MQNKHGFASALRYILDHSEGELNEKEIQEYIRKEIKHVTEKLSVHFGIQLLMQETSEYL